MWGENMELQLKGCSRGAWSILCFLRGIAPRVLDRRGKSSTSGHHRHPYISTGSTSHQGCGPAPKQARGKNNFQKADLGTFHTASASLQRQKVQIKDKKGSIMLPGPPVHSQLAQCWEDSALLFIRLSGSLSHLPHSSLFPSLLSASCLRVSIPTSCRHFSPLPKYHQTPLNLTGAIKSEAIRLFSANLHVSPRLPHAKKDVEEDA